MRDTYTFAGMILCIVHEDDQLFREINDELQPYYTESAGEPDFTVVLEKNGIGYLPPNGAVRAWYGDGKAVYMHENSIYIWKKNSFLIRTDPVKKVIEVRYHRYGENLYLQLRSLIKWYFFIRGSEERNLTYIHAAAVRYNGMNILFSGDSHSGKSSSLFRLVRHGAQVITDDAVIIDRERLIPFFLNTATDRDFTRRFHLSGNALNAGHYIRAGELLSGIDMIFILHIWHNDKTLIKKMDYTRALLSLMRIYRKEVRFNLLSDQEKESHAMYKKVFDRYAMLLKNAACLELYAGYNEEEVEDTLLGFINAYKRDNPDI